MSRLTPFAFGLALPLTLVSHVALADLTPTQVWSDWQQYLEGFGYKVGATQTANGADLSVGNINLTVAMPEDAGTVKMNIGNIDFRQNSDGTVAILMPAAMPIRVEASGGLAEEQDFTMTLNQSGHAMTASGTPEQMTYLYTSDMTQMVLDSVQLDVQNVSRPDGRMSFTANTVSNTTVMTIGETRSYDQSSTIATAVFDVTADPDADGGEKVAIKGQMSGLTLNGSGKMPVNVPDATDMSAMLNAGFDVAGRFAYESGSSDFDVDDPMSGNLKVQTSSEGGELTVALGQNGIAYGGAQKNIKVAVNSQAMPFPFEFAMAQSGFNLVAPLKKDDMPQDFAFGINLTDFTMSDLLWGIFDPTSQFPRDPATIKLDLSGKAKVLVDFMDPKVAGQMTGAPGQLEAVQLNTLLVEAVGAKLQGNGALTFDGTGPSMVPGMGSPVGAITLALAGGNGLLDKLTAMGLLPQEQAMGARMMMGIFAVPGSAPDTLDSKIEFTKDGQILANGQRIR